MSSSQATSSARKISLPGIREFFPEFNAPLSPRIGHTHTFDQRATVSVPRETPRFQVPHRQHSSSSVGIPPRTALDDMFPRSYANYPSPALLSSPPPSGIGRLNIPQPSLPISSSNSSSGHSTYGYASETLADASRTEEHCADSDDTGSLSGTESNKKHVCRHCLKRFNRPSSLNIHLNIHLGRTPFKCPWPYCGREFNVNSNMRRHLRNHATGGFTHTRSTDLRSRHAAGLALIDPRTAASHRDPPSSSAHSTEPMADTVSCYRSVNDSGVDSAIHHDSTDRYTHVPHHLWLPYSAYRQHTAEYSQSHARAVPRVDLPTRGTDRSASFGSRPYATHSPSKVHIKEEPRSLALVW